MEVASLGNSKWGGERRTPPPNSTELSNSTGSVPWGIFYAPRCPPRCQTGANNSGPPIETCGGRGGHTYREKEPQKTEEKARRKGDQKKEHVRMERSPLSHCPVIYLGGGRISFVIHTGAATVRCWLGKVGTTKRERWRISTKREEKPLDGSAGARPLTQNKDKRTSGRDG